MSKNVSDMYRIKQLKKDKRKLKKKVKKLKKQIKEKTNG